MSETTTKQINRAQFNNKQKELLRDVVTDLEAQIAAEVAALNATISGLPTAPTETLIVQSTDTGPVSNVIVPAFVAGTEFTWDLEADKSYVLEGTLWFDAASDTGVNINFDSSTATGSHTLTLTGVTSQPTTDTIKVGNGSAIIGSSSVLLSMVEASPSVYVSGVITCTGAGTFQLNWSNAAATGNDTLLSVRSYLKLREVA